MKKQLFTLALGISSLAGFSQASTVWQPYNSNMDTSTYVRNLSVVDTNTVWGIGFVSGYPTTNKFTRTIDGANFHSGKFNPDTLNYAPSGLWAVNANTAFIVTNVKAGSHAPSGQILKTTDGGATWNNMTTTGMFTGSLNFPDWAYFWDANNGLVFGDPDGNTAGGADDMWEIYRTHDGGTTWIRVPDANVPTPIIGSLSGEGDAGLESSFAGFKHFLWAGTYNGLVLASADSGKTWTYPNTTTIGLDGGVNGLAFRDSIHGMAWGYDGFGNNAVVSTLDGGANWAPVTTGSVVGVNAICTIPKTQKGYMSVGIDSASVQASNYLTSVTYDDGATWTVLESSPILNNDNAIRMLSVQMVDSSNGWAGSYSDNTPPLGKGGINRFHLGHKTTCDINITAASSITIGGFNVCSDSMITMTASGLDTYTWSANAGSVTTASVSVTPTITTTYSVSGTTTAGCANFTTFDVTVVTYSLTAAATHSICPGASTPLHVNGGVTTYTWAPATGLSATTASNTVSTTTVPVTYTISTNDVKNGCPINPATIAMIMKPVPSLTLTASTYSVCGTIGTSTLTAAGASSYAWTLSHPSGTASSSTVVVTPVSTGTASSYVSTYSVTGNINGCTSKSTITLTVTACTGIENYTSTNNVSLYPNPSTGLVTISLSSVEAGTVMYVTNMIGQQVAKTTLKDLNTEFNFSTLEKGVYFVTVTNGNNKHVEKLIIQ